MVNTGSGQGRYLRSLAPAYKHESISTLPIMPETLLRKRVLLSMSSQLVLAISAQLPMPGFGGTTTPTFAVPVSSSRSRREAPILDLPVQSPGIVCRPPPRIGHPQEVGTT